MSDASTEVMVERGEVYGLFSDNSEVAMLLIEALMSGSRWDSLARIEKNGLIMVAEKMSRVVSGKQYHRDNYLDMETYPRLIREHFDGLTAGNTAESTGC